MLSFQNVELGCGAQQDTLQIVIFDYSKGSKYPYLLRRHVGYVSTRVHVRSYQWNH